MSAMIERRLMLRHGLKYSEARDITMQVRDNLGLGSHECSEKMEAACVELIESRQLDGEERSSNPLQGTGPPPSMENKNIHEEPIHGPPCRVSEKDNQSCSQFCRIGDEKEQDDDECQGSLAASETDNPSNSPLLHVKTTAKRTDETTTTEASTIFVVDGIPSVIYIFTKKKERTKKKPTALQRLRRSFRRKKNKEILDEHCTEANQETLLSI